MSASANYYRLKCEGFVSLRDEFPSVPESWTPVSTADGDEQHVNASGVSLAEVPRCVWIPTATTSSMSRAELRAYVAMLESECYEDAGDVWGTFNKLKGQFERGEDEEEESTEDNNNDEPSATEVEAASEDDADAATSVAETEQAVAVASAAVERAEVAVEQAKDALVAMQSARAGLTVVLKRHRGEGDEDDDATKRACVC
jgi:hypothetical protein